MNWNNRLFFVVFAIFCIIIISIIATINFLSIVGILMVLYLVQLLIKDCSYTFMPIPEIAGIIAGIQWIISPTMSYWFGHSMYSMSVAESTYMINTLIMYIPFWSCIIYNNRNRKMYFDSYDLNIFCCNNLKLIKSLIVVGFIFTLISGISFIVTLLSSFLYIGLIMLMVAFPKNAVKIALIAIAFSLLKSIRSAMFHDTIIWGLFILLALFYVDHYAMKKKLIVIAFCLVGVFTLQGVKAIYRSIVWNGETDNKIELFTSLMFNSIVSENENNNLIDSNDRFNQGWIISRIYSHIPVEQDYIGGRTIWEGLVRSISPSAIISNTKNKGEASRQDFMEFTGVRINDSTNMGLSVIGEAYGNFGLIGGSIFMFIWGLFVIWIVNFVVKKSFVNGIWIFMLPIICFTLIKAETNFLSVINWTVKALIFTWFIAWILQHYFNIKGIELANE